MDGPIFTPDAFMDASGQPVPQLLALGEAFEDIDSVVLSPYRAEDERLLLPSGPRGMRAGDGTWLSHPQHFPGYSILREPSRINGWDILVQGEVVLEALHLNRDEWIPHQHPTLQIEVNLADDLDEDNEGNRQVWVDIRLLSEGSADLVRSRPG